MLKIFNLTEDVGTLEFALTQLHVPYECVGVYIQNPQAYHLYETLHGTVRNYLNLSNEPLPTLDLVAYRLTIPEFKQVATQSYPFSSDKLSFTHTLIEHQKPRYLIMETTKTVLGKVNSIFFQAWIKQLETWGYQNFVQSLNAKDYNLPHYRERVFMVSILNPEATFEFPPSQPLTQTFRSYLETEVSNDNYYSAKFHLLPIRELPLGEPHPIGYCTTHPTATQPTAQQLVFSLTGLCPTISGGYYKSPVKIFLTPPIQTTPISSHRYQLVSPVHQAQLVRKLTPRECWRLMGLADSDYDRLVSLPLSKTQLYQHIGQANTFPIWKEVLATLLT